LRTFKARERYRKNENEKKKLYLIASREKLTLKNLAPEKKSQLIKTFESFRSSIPKFKRHSILNFKLINVLIYFPAIDSKAIEMYKRNAIIPKSLSMDGILFNQT
jgi:hypothetical protein